MLLISTLSHPSHDIPQEVQDGVIRVQAPQLTKSSALIQLEASTTAADVVAKFRGEEVMYSVDRSVAVRQ